MSGMHSLVSEFVTSIHGVRDQKQNIKPRLNPISVMW